MKVESVMNRAVTWVTPTATLANAAELMAEWDLGALLVLDDRRLVGIVTDRDLAVRGLAAGLHGSTLVFRVMTKEVVTCTPETDLSEAMRIMAERGIRRIPVCSGEGELVGIVTLADTARSEEYREASGALSRICRADGQRCRAEKSPLSSPK